MPGERPREQESVHDRPLPAPERTEAPLGTRSERTSNGPTLAPAEPRSFRPADSVRVHEPVSNRTGEPITTPHGTQPDSRKKTQDRADFARVMANHKKLGGRARDPGESFAIGPDGPEEDVVAVGFEDSARPIPAPERKFFPKKETIGLPTSAEVAFELAQLTTTEFEYATVTGLQQIESAVHETTSTESQLAKNLPSIEQLKTASDAREKAANKSALIAKQLASSFAPKKLTWRESIANAFAGAKDFLATPITETKKYLADVGLSRNQEKELETYLVEIGQANEPLLVGEILSQIETIAPSGDMPEANYLKTIGTVRSTWMRAEAFGRDIKATLRNGIGTTATAMKGFHDKLSGAESIARGRTELKRVQESRAIAQDRLKQYIAEQASIQSRAAAAGEKYSGFIEDIQDAFESTKRAVSIQLLKEWVADAKTTKEKFSQGSQSATELASAIKIQTGKAEFARKEMGRDATKSQRDLINQFDDILDQLEDFADIINTTQTDLESRDKVA